MDIFGGRKKPEEAGVEITEETQPLEPSAEEPDGASSGEGCGEMPGESLSELKERLEIAILNYQEQGQLLEQLIRNQIDVKDGLIDRLHRELEFYKDDSLERYKDELMKSVIRVHRSMARNMGRDSWDILTADELRMQYQYIYEDITDLLEQQGIDAYSTPAGAEFDPAIHQARTEAVSDPELDRKIRESLSCGYRKGTRTMIPERVTVYRYTGTQ